VSEPSGERTRPAQRAAGDGPTYAAAVDELEAILAELEDDRLDVDQLAERVARAAELIRLCRERIRATRLEVEQIVADLDGPEEGA
jgi:exodeoxyribonuclease VII small subunit